MTLNLSFILASASPRRRALLERLGWPFRVEVSPVEETAPERLIPDDLVRHLARKKNVPIAARHPEALTLAADTVVALEDDVLGKPADDDEARATLRRLSGRTHVVYTGLALAHPATGRAVTTHEATRVTFGTLTDPEVDAYVATGSPLDKAGSYGIQDDLGALFVERIDGDYYNVVGLPLHRLYRTLRARFPDALSL